MQPVARELYAAFVEQIDVEVGVQFLRALVKLRHLVRAVRHSRKVGGRHPEQSRQLVAPFHQRQTVGLAFREEFEEKRALVLVDGGGDALLHRAARIARLHRVVHFREGDVGGICAIFAHIFGGESAVSAQRFAEGVHRAFCVRHRLAARKVRLHAVEFQQIADVVERFEFGVRQRHRAHIEEGEQIARVLSEMFEFQHIDFQHAFAVPSPLVVIGKAAYVAERRLLDVAALFRAQRKLGQHVEIVVEGTFREFFVEQAVYVQAVGRVLVGEIVEYRFVKREAEIAFAVHRVQLFLQFFEGDGDFRRLFFEVLFRRFVRKREGVDDVVQHHVLVGFVGVQFQTEVAEPDVLQSAVDDGQRRHLFRDEQNSPSAHYVVCYDVGYRLRFARAGRSVQHETLGKAVVNRGVLRAVGGNGQEHSFLAYVRFVAAAVREVESVLGQFQPVVDEGAHDGMFAEAVALVSDVVPEQIVAEGQTCEEYVSEHVPALEPDRFALDARKHREHSLRRGQVRGSEPAHIEVELLIQKFQQRAVDPEVVRVDFYGIDGSGDALFAYGHGIEEEGGVLVFAGVLFLPFEKSRREVERQRARFFLNGLFLAEEAEQRGFVVARFEHRA